MSLDVHQELVKIADERAREAELKLLTAENQVGHISANKVHTSCLLTVTLYYSAYKSMLQLY